MSSPNSAMMSSHSVRLNTLKLRRYTCSQACAFQGGDYFQELHCTTPDIPPKEPVDKGRTRTFPVVTPRLGKGLTSDTQTIQSPTCSPLLSLKCPTNLWCTVSPSARALAVYLRPTSSPDSCSRVTCKANYRTDALFCLLIAGGHV